ncbi:MAG: HEAT repeat domain-containing protein [Polyangiales bacterium]
MTTPSKRELVERLGNAKSAPERIAAAVAMGWHGAPEYAPLLVSKLMESPEPRVVSAYCVALEMIADRSVLGELMSWLKRCPDAHVWDICRVLRRLRCIDPIIPPGTDVERLRQLWLDAGEDVPAVQNVRVSGNHIRFDVTSGSGRVRIDFDAPKIGTSNWARWTRSLFVGDNALYSVGSTCGTCETLLVLAGFPEDHALELSRELSATMLMPSFDSEWVRTWTPVLTQLQTGHYLATSLALPIERVDTSGASWMTKRYEFRIDTDPDWPSDDEQSPWPTTPHFQGPMFGEPLRTYWVTLPSQDLAALDEERVHFYMERIRDGHRPSALALGWMEDRYVQAEWNERVVATVLLDGHHKMEAYARLKVPASLIALFHLENTWGPREDPARPLLDAIAQLEGSLSE